MNPTGGATIRWPTRHIDAATPVQGRFRAPELIQPQSRSGRIADPYPARRDLVRKACLVAGLVMAAATVAVDLRLTVAVLVVALVAVALVPGYLIPTPAPAFPIIDEILAHQLLAGSWIRIRIDHRPYAVQAVHVTTRVPDTVGDPTPPVIEVRCSDQIVRRYRPHDSLQVVFPVDAH